MEDYLLMTDRQNLEWLVYHAWQESIISIGRGKELLRFKTMNDMRDWLNNYGKQEGV